MSRKMIKRPAQPAARALANRVDNAAGVPICELLNGSLTIDGAPAMPTDPRLTAQHSCTLASSPALDCPFTLRAIAEVVELETGEWAYHVVEDHPAVLSALTGPERASAVNVSASEIRRGPGPPSGAPAKPARG